MVMTKRIIRIMLAAVLLIVLVSGCNTADADSRITVQIISANTDSTTVPRGSSFAVTARYYKSWSGGTVSGIFLYGEIYKDGVLYSRKHTSNVSLMDANTKTIWLSFPTDPYDADATYSIKCWFSDDMYGSNVYSNQQTINNLSVTDYSMAVLNIEADTHACEVNQDVTWSVSLSDPSSTQQCTYSIFDLSTGLTVATGTGTTFQRMFEAPGEYNVKVNVVDGNRYAQGNDTFFLDGYVQITDPAEPWMKSLESDHDSIVAGGTNTWHVTAIGGTGEKKYRYGLYKDDMLVTQSGWVLSADYSCQIDEAGQYTLRAEAMDAEGHICEEPVSSRIMTVVQGLAVDRITVCDTSYVGTAFSWAASLAGSSDGAEYKWIVYRDDSLVMTQNWMAGASSLSYTPSAPGVYRASVTARNADGDMSGSLISKDTVVVKLPEITSVTPDHSTGAPMKKTAWNVRTTGGYGRLQYHYELYCNDELFRDYGWIWNNYEKTYEYTDSGVYVMKVTIRDENGTESNMVTSALEVVDHVPELANLELTYSPLVGNEIGWTVDITSLEQDGTLTFAAVLRCDGNTVYEEDNVQSFQTQYDYYTYRFNLNREFELPGQYELIVCAVDGDGDRSYPVTLAFTVESVPRITGYSFSTADFRAGQPYTLTATVSGGKEPLTFSFRERRRTAGINNEYFGGTYSEASANPSITYMHEYPASYSNDHYIYEIRVRDANGNSDMLTTSQVVILPGPVIQSVTLPKQEGRVTEDGTWTIRIGRADELPTVHIRILNDGEVCQTAEIANVDYSCDYTYTFAQDGDYTLEVYAEDGTYTSATFVSNAFHVMDPRPRIDSIVPDKESCSQGDELTWTINAGGFGTDFSYFCRLLRNGKLFKAGSWIDTNTYTALLSDAGTYQLQVRVSNAEGYASEFISSDEYLIPCSIHIPAVDAGIAPTCETSGLTEGSHCETCGKILVQQESVAPLGHSYVSSYTYDQINGIMHVTRVCTRDSSHTSSDARALVLTYLPASLREIDEEAFSGSAFAGVVLPDTCTRINSCAFADCKQLMYIFIPAGTEVADDAFDGCADVWIDMQ